MGTVFDMIVVKPHLDAESFNRIYGSRASVEVSSRINSLAGILEEIIFYLTSLGKFLRRDTEEEKFPLFVHYYLGNGSVIYESLELLITSGPFILLYVVYFPSGELKIFSRMLDKVMLRSVFTGTSCYELKIDALDLKKPKQ